MKTLSPFFFKNSLIFTSFSPSTQQNFLKELCVPTVFPHILSSHCSVLWNVPFVSNMSVKNLTKDTNDLLVAKIPWTFGAPSLTPDSTDIVHDFLLFLPPLPMTVSSLRHGQASPVDFVLSFLLFSLSLSDLTYSFTPQVFIEHPLQVWHWSKPWRYNKCLLSWTWQLPMVSIPSGPWWHINWPPARISLSSVYLVCVAVPHTPHTPYFQN